MNTFVQQRTDELRKEIESVISRVRENDLQTAGELDALLRHNMDDPAEMVIIRDFLKRIVSESVQEKTKVENFDRTVASAIKPAETIKARKQKNRQGREQSPHLKETLSFLGDHLRGQTLSEDTSLRRADKEDTATQGKIANTDILSNTPLEKSTPEKNIEEVLNRIRKPYTAKDGDLIFSIIENRLSDEAFFNTLSKEHRRYLIEKLIRKVTNLSPEELKNIGIGSGDANNVAKGERIQFTKIFQDVPELRESLEEYYIPEESTNNSPMTEEIPQVSKEEPEKLVDDIWDEVLLSPNDDKDTPVEITENEIAPDRFLKTKTPLETPGSLPKQLVSEIPKEKPPVETNQIVISTPAPPPEVVKNETTETSEESLEGPERMKQFFEKVGGESASTCRYKKLWGKDDPLFPPLSKTGSGATSFDMTYRREGQLLRSAIEKIEGVFHIPVQDGETVQMFLTRATNESDDASEFLKQHFGPVIQEIIKRTRADEVS